MERHPWEDHQRQDRSSCSGHRNREGPRVFSLISSTQIPSRELHSLKPAEPQQDLGAKASSGLLPHLKGRDRSRPGQPHPGSSGEGGWAGPLGARGRSCSSQGPPALPPHSSWQGRGWHRSPQQGTGRQQHSERHRRQQQEPQASKSAPPWPVSLPHAAGKGFPRAGALEKADFG